MQTIQYTDSLDGIQAQHLQGFFVGWQKHPSPERHLAILQGSSHVWLAQSQGRVVGFINAISDGVLTAYIPLLEVLPDYQGRGIGSELVRLLLADLSQYYMIDLICDARLQAFYERFGGHAYTGIIWRNYERQAGG